MPEYALNLRDYWRILRKRKAVVLVTTLSLGFFSFVFANLKRPAPLYSATASVKYEKTYTLTGLYLETMTWSSGDIETQAAIIRSYPVMERAAKKLGYIDPNLTSEQIRSDERLMGIVLGLQGRISTKVEGYTNIIDITAMSYDPDQAQRLANAVAEAYREYNSEEKNKRIIEARRFIEQQLAKKREELRKAEDAVRKFREEHELISLDSRTKEVISELSRARSEYERLEGDIREISSMIDQLRRREPLSKEAMGLFSDRVSRVFRSLNDRLVSLRVQRATLLNVYTGKHPKVRQVDSEMENVSENMIAELEAQRRTLEERKELVARKLKRLEEEFRTLPQEAQTLDKLQHEVEVIKRVVELLESKYQEALIKESEKVEEVSIVRPALRPWRPINPPRTKAAAVAGLVMGLVLGVVFAFIVESLDTSIGTIEDVEKYLGVPVLGIIPHMTTEEIKRTLLEEYIGKDDEEVLNMKARLISHFAPKSALAESFRALRTSVQFSGLEQGAKTIVITSSSRLEGKTTVAVNLAVVMAQAGSRVLLVEGDMRVPVISKIFGIERSPGLSEIILGSHRWEDVVRTVTDVMMGRIRAEDILAVPGMDNLHIITCGTLPPNPAELFNFRRTDEFISQVREKYNVVIFDSPPVLPVTDTVILGSKVDGVVLVYRVGRIGRGALRRAKVQLDGANAKVLGVVLNGLRPEVSPDFQGYKYPRYYGYGREEKVPWWRKLIRPIKFRPPIGKRMAMWLIAGLGLISLALGAGFLWQKGSFSVRKRKAEVSVKQETTRPSEVPKVGKRPYVVHLYSFKHPNLAERCVDLLRKEGYQAFLSPAQVQGKGVFYRVFIGSFRTEEEARKVAEHLKEVRRVKYAGVLELPYTISLGSFTSKQEADEEARNLRSSGLFTYTVSGRKGYRLLLGAFATEEEAKLTAEDLARKGIRAQVVLR